jgi:hypothetical protein
MTWCLVFRRRTNASASWFVSWPVVPFVPQETRSVEVPVHVLYTTTGRRSVHICLDTNEECTVWGFHDGDYEKCRLLGYKNPVSTSQKTHYFTTETSQLMLCKIWGFHGSDYEECRLLGYKNPVRTSQKTHYFTTETSQLMLGKIWGFHGSGYEECRLLGYKNPVSTSQKTHYFTTETSQLMLCKIWGFHGGGYEGCRLLGYKTQFVHHRRHSTSPLQRPAS